MTKTATLIFDGDCGFCTSTANYIVKHSRVPITAVAWQLTDVTQFGFTPEQTAKKVRLAVGEHRYGGHEAFAHLLILQHRWWLTPLAYLSLVPPISWISAFGYRLVARYRHKLPGGTPACKLPR